MARKNLLTSSPPYAVEQAIHRLGANLRTARLRRNLSVEDVAQKIGTGRRAVMEAEKGKASTSAAVYLALLRAYAEPQTQQRNLFDDAAQRDFRRAARRKPRFLGSPHHRKTRGQGATR